MDYENKRRIRETGKRRVDLSMVMQLQSNYDLWYNSAQKAERKLEAVKNTISSLVVFID